MSDADFPRTLSTAAEAEVLGKLLERAASDRGSLTPTDRARLTMLAGRYRDYAAALREVAAEHEAPAEEQARLL